MGTLRIASPAGKEAIRQSALAYGADLAGVVEIHRLQDPAAAGSMKTFVVFAKRMLRGVAWARHLPTKQLAGGRTLRVLDQIGSRLAYWLEDRGYPSVPIPTGVFDFERTLPEDITPAGQGSHLLRQAAVEAGLGTWGLNMMVLTPRFGPRVYLGGVMTELEVEGDRPLEGELCLGLEECGRCAAICPENAIPTQAAAGAPVASYRDLDRAACCRSSQPFGFGAFVQHVAGIVQSLDATGMWTRLSAMRGRRTGDVWSEMAIMKEGAMTGCSHCTQVCPVGADYEAIQKSPHRRQDLPGDVIRESSGGLVRIQNVGPAMKRTTAWDWTKQ